MPISVTHALLRVNWSCNYMEEEIDRSLLLTYLPFLKLWLYCGCIGCRVQALNFQCRLLYFGLVGLLYSSRYDQSQCVRHKPIYKKLKKKKIIYSQYKVNTYLFKIQSIYIRVSHQVVNKHDKYLYSWIDHLLWPILREYFG